MAEEDEQKVTELTGLQKKIKKISRKINALKGNKNILQNELRKLDTAYGERATLLKQLGNQITDFKSSLNKNRQSINKKQQSVEFQKKELEREMLLAHKVGGNEKLKLMLSQQDAPLAGRMIIYHELWSKARLNKISKIKQGLQALHQLEEKQLKETALLKEKLSERTLEQSLLLEKKSERTILLTKINRQFSSKRKQLSRFKASETRLKSLVSSLEETVEDYFPYEKQEGKSFAKLKRKLPWPIIGKIVQKFGAKRSDSRWDGVLIEAKEGEEIKAVSKGRIVYADWLRGYGLLTIIDHSDGYMTLYAFNQNLYKVVGDLVKVGSVIATVGQSGGQVDAGLYFGVRKKGKPVDPVKWCRKIQRGITR